MTRRAGAVVLHVASAVLSTAVMVGGAVWWLWSMVVWGQLYGLVGLVVGLFTISDFALPFVVHHETGAWPWPWILTLAGLLLVWLVASILDAAAEAILERDRL